MITSVRAVQIVEISEFEALTGEWIVHGLQTGEIVDIVMPRALRTGEATLGEDRPVHTLDAHHHQSPVILLNPLLKLLAVHLVTDRLQYIQVGYKTYRLYEANLELAPPLRALLLYKA